MLDGEYDEEEQARQFQEALKAWRNGGTTSNEAKKEEKQEKKVKKIFLREFIEGTLRWRRG